jgi:inhibitor of KinA sporulation pathway (predicted exonuclease)
MRYVIVDLEATCWMERVATDRIEIIEIGAASLASETPTESEFSSFVRPIHEPTLSAFCMGLTGIRQKEIDSAADFSKVFPRFLRWAGDETYRLCSWGAFDLLQFKTDCARHGLPVPPEFSTHINLKQEFARLKGVRPCGVKRALALSGLAFEGRHHRAIDDARNIARLATHVLLPQTTTKPGG